MDMLIPLTPVSQLTEEEKRALRAQMQTKNRTATVGGKIVNLDELRDLQPPVQPAVRQKLFE